MLHNLVFSFLKFKCFCSTIKATSFFFLLFSATIFGQQSKISGTVLDQNNAPISFVTVLVNNISEEKGASGAVFVKGTTTDDLGNFTLENVEHGNYTLHFSFIGFQSQTKQIHLTSPVFLEAIVLLESSEMLDQANITSDVTALYISNLIFGSYTYKNQFNLSASVRKKIWDKKASITLGVDDIFNTNNIPVVSRYANQDNGYFARTESRLFRVGFTYNFGNSKLRDNNREITTKESDRLN